MPPTQANGSESCRRGFPTQLPYGTELFGCAPSLGCPPSLQPAAPPNSASTAIDKAKKSEVRFRGPSSIAPLSLETDPWRHRRVANVAPHGRPSRDHVRGRHRQLSMRPTQPDQI